MGRTWWRRSQHSSSRGGHAHQPRRPTLTVESLEDRSVPTAGVLKFSAPIYSVLENVGQATITVTRTGGTTGVVDVQFATANGSAVAGTDYTAESGMLTFANGEASKTFMVPILNNTHAQANETVNLTLSNPDGGAILGSQSTATLILKDQNLTHSQRFVVQIFQDLLHRSPTPTSLNYWSNLIHEGAITRVQLVNLIVNGSEFRRLLITNAFQSILGRAPTTAMLTALDTNMAQGESIETIESQLYGSTEYFANHGGTRASFLSATFQSVVGKPINAAAMTLYANLLSQGSTRGHIAALILNRNDALSLRVTNYFHEFLHRDPAPVILSTVVNEIHNGLTDQQLIAQLVGSGEYWDLDA